MRDKATGTDEREEWDEWFANRPRGVLSPKERKHLMGRLDEDLKENKDAIRQREYRIRQHIHHSILDFILLCGSPVAQRTLEDFYEASHSPPMTDERRSMECLINFLFSGEDIDVDVEDDMLDWSDVPTFDSILNRGVRQTLIDSYAEEGVSVKPHVGFAVDLGGQVPIEEVQAVYERNGSEDYLFPAEIEALRVADVLTNDEFEEAVVEWHEPELSEVKDAVKSAYERRGREVVWKDDHFEDVTSL